ncbi:hypothetical protein B0T24DRAFT_610245 [Lasiosphaeria ovina]|uniref:Cyclin-like domain-containing protein n=1 Tax=Lasiosphaeria ovina TaxID=92902 RepID=A0AAE0KLX1_9PEZI|nr:hypothetical protein B0T24DRAFT_610245 [Lasiosphaeria ovina]
MSPAAIRQPPTIKASTGGGGAKPKTKRPNAVRRIMDREQNRERRERESSVAASAISNPAGLAARPSRFRCANKKCKNPNVQDGTCQSCGQVADDSNIVSEITFGEAGNGAAVVQGSYLAADQGGVRPVGGLAFRRVAGGGASEARERSLRESKQLMTDFVYQLRVPVSLVDSAFRLYKIASSHNFIQGRRKANVAAICMYAACRKEMNNKVMLIDLADIIKTDVFLLGRSYKEFLAQFPDQANGTQPIILEDLIFRFASKLEFVHDTNKVAESAVRIAARMRFDNMTHGRRPAGICGAALIMAARAHNYRRTVREVVYIAKVTMATIQTRMEEFANVPSAQMTIAEFHDNAFLENAEDPPAVIKQSKLKRKAQALAQTETQTGEPTEGQGREKRARTASGVPSTAGQGVPAPVAGIITPAPSATPATATALDKDGFVVPPLPQRTAGSTSTQPSSQLDDQPMSDTAADGRQPDDQQQDDEELEALADQFGDEPADESDDDSDLDPTSEMAMAAAQGIEIPGQKHKRPEAPKAVETPVGSVGPKENPTGTTEKVRGKKPVIALPIDEEWEMDEANLEQEMESHLQDPELLGASEVVAKDVQAKRAQESAANASEQLPPAEAGGDDDDNTDRSNEAGPGGETATEEPETEPDFPLDPRFTPRSKISNSRDIGEDEFADDPEVLHCRLSDNEVKIKEMIWANHNKEYMRQMQQKIFNKKLAENEPPKQRRNRAKKPRIGEGQASPAQSAEEAAVNMMRARAISTKLDYSRLGQVFDMSKRGPGSMYDGTSSVGSRSALPSIAGSEVGSDVESDGEDGVVRGDALRSSVGAPSDTNTTAPSVTQPAAVEKAAPTAIPVDGGDDEAAEDEFDGNETEFGGADAFEEETFAEDDFSPFADDDDEGFGAGDMDDE